MNMSFAPQTLPSSKSKIGSNKKYRPRKKALSKNAKTGETLAKDVLGGSAQWYNKGKDPLALHFKVCKTPSGWRLDSDSTARLG